jgi:hypothetical protein
LADDADRAGQSYLVFDDHTGYEPVAVAEHLIDRGASVTFVTRRETLAAALGPIGRSDTVLADLYRSGRFTLHTLAFVTAIGPDSCTVRRAHGGEELKIPVSRAVIVGPRTPVVDLVASLRDRFPDVRVVGDALSARNLQAAVHEGHHVARGIS